MMAALLSEGAASIPVIEGAIGPPVSAASIAEMVSSCSSLKLDIVSTPANGTLGISCLASISLWKLFLCDLPS